MFNLFKKKEQPELNYSDSDIVAITDGYLIKIEDVADPIFAQKMMGDGVAFKIISNKICSPCNGKVVTAFPTGHAFGIISNEGVELLIHIGIDTVKNNGVGFKPLVKQGEKVKAGQIIAEIDLKQLEKKYDMTTMLIITNQKEINFIDPQKVKMGTMIRKES